MKQVGIPLFYLQGMGGGAVLKYRDLFNDSSLHWAWRKYLGLTPAGKAGSESLGRYHLSVNPTKNAEWDGTQSEAPRIFMGLLTYPCEIITRLDTFSALDDITAGLFITKDPIGFGGSLYWAIEMRRSLPDFGVAVTRDGTTFLAQTGVITLPMWLRIRIACSSYRGFNAYFDYSIDGLTWVNLWVEQTSTTYLTLNPACVGLYVSNYGTHQEVVASFDHFIMRPRSIN